MQTRFKTLSEFYKSITLINRPGGGIKILCRRNNHIIVETKTKPWNTPDTRHYFLVKLYIREILFGKNVSKRITRITGYEFLGRRCMYKDDICVIISWVEGVNSQTGEVMYNFTISKGEQNHPFDVLSINIQL